MAKLLVVCHVTLSPILLRMSLTCYFPQCNFVSYFLSCFMKITYLEKILQKIPGETVRAEVGRAFFLLATHFWKENNHNPILWLVTDLSQKSFLLASSAFHYTFQNHCSMGHLILLSFFWKQLLIELRVTRFLPRFRFTFIGKLFELQLSFYRSWALPTPFRWSILPLRSRQWSLQSGRMEPPSCLPSKASFAPSFTVFLMAR